MLTRVVVTNMWHWRILKMVKRPAAKARVKGHGKRFSKSLDAELSVLRVEREKERELLKENRSLKSHLMDTAEVVHDAGEFLVRLREAEEAAAAAHVLFKLEFGSYDFLFS
ncbi:putative kinesin-like protein [Helianthus anomalus]